MAWHFRVRLFVCFTEICIVAEWTDDCCYCNQIRSVTGHYMWKTEGMHSPWLINPPHDLLAWALQHQALQWHHFSPCHTHWSWTCQVNSTRIGEVDVSPLLCFAVILASGWHHGSFFFTMKFQLIEEQPCLLSAQNKFSSKNVVYFHSQQTLTKSWGQILICVWCFPLNFSDAELSSCQSLQSILSSK